MPPVIFHCLPCGSCHVGSLRLPRCRSPIHMPCETTMHLQVTTPGRNMVLLMKSRRCNREYKLSQMCCSGTLGSFRERMHQGLCVAHVHAGVQTRGPVGWHGQRQVRGISMVNTCIMLLERCVYDCAIIISIL